MIDVNFFVVGTKCPVECARRVSVPRRRAGPGLPCGRRGGSAGAAPAPRRKRSAALVSRVVSTDRSPDHGPRPRGRGHDTAAEFFWRAVSGIYIFTFLAYGTRRPAREPARPHAALHAAAPSATSRRAGGDETGTAAAVSRIVRVGAWRWRAGARSITTVSYEARAKSRPRRSASKGFNSHRTHRTSTSAANLRRAVRRRRPEFAAAARPAYRCPTVASHS